MWPLSAWPIRPPPSNGSKRIHHEEEQWACQFDTCRFSGCGHLSWSDMPAGPAVGRTVTWYWISASSRRVTASRDAMIAVTSVPPGAETEVVLDWFGLMHAADQSLALAERVSML